MSIDMSLEAAWDYQQVWGKYLGNSIYAFGRDVKAVLEMRSQIWDLVPIGTKALEWCQISPISARESQISSVWEDAKLSPIYPHLTNKVPKKYQISPL